MSDYFKPPDGLTPEERKEWKRNLFSQLYQGAFFPGKMWVIDDPINNDDHLLDVMSFRHYSSGPGAALRRCSSFLAEWEGAKRINDIQCSLEAGHIGNHLGKSRAKLMVEWNDVQAREALEPRPLPMARVEGPITGWKSWPLDVWPIPEMVDVRRHKLDFSLMTEVTKTRWQSPVMTTRLLPDSSGFCRVWQKNDPQGRPPEGFDYGIYSYKTLWGLRAHHWGTTHWRNDVVGKVEVLPGHAIEHEWGYRAQIVIVRELWALGAEGYEQKTLIEALSSRYACPVTVISTSKVDDWVNYMIEEERRA